jgi:S1-C subfamily serine protease
MSKKDKKVKKICGFGFLLILIFLVGGFAGIVGERFVMPWLASFPSLEKYSFIQRANDRVTVIRQTKEINVKEDFSVANIAEKVSPSVVSIISFKEGATRDSILGQIKSSQDIQKNVKTGLILTNDGLIVSILDEVVKEALENEESKKDEVWKFKILASNNREFDAEIFAVDEFSNLVFYKVERTDLPIPELGNSSEIEIGEKVVVCGNAGGEYQNSFSSGLVKEMDHTFSLLNSELSSSERLEGAFLLDSIIEKRNVGGPVLDYNGTVIGIANEIEKDGEEVGFVVPIDNLKPIINKVIKKENFSNPFLGVYYLSINREIALLNGLDVNRGALIYSFSGQQGLAVIKDSPADEAGIKIGDIITSVAGTSIDLENPLSYLVSRYKSGDEVEFRIIRDGEKIKVSVKLE